MTEEGRAQAAATELELAGEELRAAGLEPRSHGGVLHLWNLHAVRGDAFDAATSRLLARLQKYRQEADYAHAFVVDADGARQELEAATELVETIRRGLASRD